MLPAPRFAALFEARAEWRSSELVSSVLPVLLTPGAKLIVAIRGLP